jgi:hypothetical protein
MDRFVDFITEPPLEVFHTYISISNFTYLEWVSNLRLILLLSIR